MNDNMLTYGAIAAGVLVLTVIIVLARRKRHRPQRLNTERYQTKWQAIQSMLKDKTLWPLAIIDADKLLEEALKTRKYRGKSMGERLVAAQHEIRDNDLVWFGHKLRNKLVHDPDVKLKKEDVKDALIGIKSALKDLGAFDEK